MISRQRECPIDGRPVPGRRSGSMGRPLIYCSIQCRRISEQRAKRNGTRRRQMRWEWEPAPIPHPGGVLDLTHAIYTQAQRDRDQAWLRDREAQGLWLDVLLAATGTDV